MPRKRRPGARLIADHVPDPESGGAGNRNLDAIAQTVEQAELDEAFQRVADGRWKKVLDTGKTVAWDHAKARLEARALGKSARKPAARKLRP